MTCGSLHIHLVETGDFALDGGAMFGVVPKSLWIQAYHAPDEYNRIPMRARCLLIRGDIAGQERTILVDTGNGEKFPPKLAAIYKIDNTHFRLENSLAQLGIQRTDVTDVILTHLHFDHAGGATERTQSGELAPTFPRARYYIQRDQLLWARNPTEKDRASFLPENFEPLISDGLVELLDGDGILWSDNATTVRLHCVHGHTKALQCVMLEHVHEHQTFRFCFPADLFPTSAHIPVPYVMAYDNFPLTTIEEKKALLPRLYEEQWSVVFEHDVALPAAYIQATERGFACGTPINCI